MRFDRVRGSTYCGSFVLWQSTRWISDRARRTMYYGTLALLAKLLQDAQHVKGILCAKLRRSGWEQGRICRAYLILSGDFMAYVVQRFALILQVAVNTSSLRLNPTLQCGPWPMSRVDLEISWWCDYLYTYTVHLFVQYLIWIPVTWDRVNHILMHRLFSRNSLSSLWI